MSTLADYMTNDHRRCDDRFALAEAAVHAGLWELAATHAAEFGAAIKHHFQMEEQVLFPAFEEETGSLQGPTAVMRSEHTQIRALLADLNEALWQRAREDFLGCADTLNTLIQQHNMKEESILYRMSDRVLAERRAELLEAMSGMTA